MTTFSIVAGLIPTALGIGAGAAQRSAIAVTIIGGQMLCLLLTLLVTPVAYSLLAEAEIRGIRFGPSWLGAPVGDGAPGRPAAPVGRRSGAAGQGPAVSPKRHPLALIREPLELSRAYSTRMPTNLTMRAAPAKVTRPRLPAEAREQDRVERLERLLDVRVAVRFRAGWRGRIRRGCGEHALGGIDEGEARAGRELQGAEARRVVAEAGRFPEVVLFGGRSGRRPGRERTRAR